MKLSDFFITFFGRISLIRVLPRLRQLDEVDVTREEKVRAGLEVSEDEEEEEDDEEEEELQKKKGLRDIGKFMVTVS